MKAYTDVLSWIEFSDLEKQGEQEQLYIRFGEIPTDEKSKIFQGEIEVGTENGVSVYPAFKTSEGDIVLGLNLPITKTTLYTQQHLIEYDDRPCYLVKGDYVGKDTDGQPLINNVSIIEKIDTYRVKEKKQGEQKPILDFKAKDWYVSKVDGKIHNIYHSDAIGKVVFNSAWSEEDKKLTDVNHEYFSELLENNNSKDINDYAYQVAYCMSHDWANETPTWDDVQKACKLGAEWNEKHHKSTWSEEDENILKSIHNSIDVECLLKNGVEYLGMVYWLKSLKDRVQPQNTWKPSDEQMKVLDSVIDEYDGYPEFDSLVSLKNDLRKL